ncbi:MAG: lamin tail domain-containing protein [Spirochaetia bacterium]|nr:lamin tail domain-containing protein [Spirochaetia bacterium]
MKRLVGAVILLSIVACNNTKDPLFGGVDPGYWLLGPYRMSVYVNDPGIDAQTMRDLKVDQRLVDLIGDAKYTVDLATYNLGKQSIINAVILAHERGVKVRMVGDVDEGATDGYRAIEAYRQIPFSLGNSAAIQHNKFAVVDKTFLFMGTGNHTDSDLLRNNNNFMVLESESLAKEYTREFEQMFYGRFGGTKVPGVHQVRQHYVNFTPIELYFSPYDGDAAMRRMVELVDGAQREVQFMIFAYTHDDLSAAMIRAARRGVLVRGIHDSTFIRGTSEEAPRLYSAGQWLPTGPFNREDGNENTSILGVSAHGGKLHCKTLIIDGSIVSTGSFNWSTNAVDNNDENMIVVQSPFVAAELQKQWENVWAVSHPITDQLDHPSGQAANPGDVVISEVMWAGSYNAAGDSASDDDWIELRNMTNHSIDLSHWSISWDNAGVSNYPIPDEFNWFEASVHTRHRSSGRLIMPANGYFLLKNVNGAIASGVEDNKISGTKGFALDSGSFKLRLYDLTMQLIDEAGNGDPPLSGKLEGTLSRTFSMERFFYPTGHPLAGRALPGSSVGSWYTSNGNNSASGATLAGTGLIDADFRQCDAGGFNCTIGTPNYSGSNSAAASNAFGGINSVQNVPIDAYSTSSTTATIQMRWGMAAVPFVNCAAGCGGLCTSTTLDPNDPSKVLVGTVAQTPGAICTLTVSGGTSDVSNPNGSGFAAGGTISLEGHGNPQAQVQIYQVAVANCSSEDVVTIRALTSGTLHNLGIYYYDSFSPNPVLLYRMHDVPILAGQFVYVRLDRPNASSEDNLLGSNPTINIADAAGVNTTCGGTLTSGLTEANTYEVYSQKNGMSGTDGIVMISYDLNLPPMDAMCYSNGDGDIATGLMEGGFRTLFRYGSSVYNISAYPVDTVNDFQVQSSCSIFTGGSANYLQRTTDTNRGSDFVQM